MFFVKVPGALNPASFLHAPGLCLFSCCCPRAKATARKELIFAGSFSNPHRLDLKSRSRVWIKIHRCFQACG